MNRKNIFWMLLGILLLVWPVGVVLGQNESISIKLNRDFGYGGMGNEIQGTFSIVVKEKGPFARVTFMMDEVVLGEVTEAPYKWQFSTDQYAPGQHQYWAVAETAEGTRLESNRINGFVLSKAEANQVLYKILGIVFGSLAAVGLISWLVSNTISKKANKTQSFEASGIPQGFTTMGGSICPKCGKAFSFHFWRLNLLTHKFDRCPHCGKWVLVKSMTLQMMENALKQTRQANHSEETKNPATEETVQEDLQRQLDQSKYIDS